ncbi:hypothetical protein [Shewanella baltica]|uniref:hypothetical protein n=1 Tax=Shewanella baltica TaxID=62322 RepID=UPI0002112D7A|nr:hypothetical protein [Shewanella baltica]AEH16209.1 hypothetical protein Sbal117_4571 [Shewanella baltica OS117]
MSDDTVSSVLSHQLEHGVFDNAKPSFAGGLAQRAIDKGYSNLSKPQQVTLDPFLTQSCCGVIDPGGHHNNCSVQLTGSDLLDAYHQSDDSESLQCDSCIQEAGDYAYRWEKMQSE